MNTMKPRKTFEEQLSQLNRSLIQMGASCEQAIDSAAKSLMEKDPELARKTIEMDAEIDHMERDIESLCLKLLLKQQPVARDLRQISSALKMISDMERIGDQAGDIAEIVLALTSQDYIKKVDHIAAMAGATIEMVQKCINAYVEQDLKLAQEVIEADDQVDNLFLTIQHELIGLIAKDPSCGEQALDFLMIAKYLERIGDHATNIAEWVEFSILGVHPEQLDGETFGAEPSQR
ncbi:MAG: phosphate signaling complex protein PhoU [Clostridiales bacterium]|nr:phosphate signaling complex protein PhoU [Clostridiales bacterium]